MQSGRADAAALTALSIADMAERAEGVESTKPFGEVAGKSVKGHGAFGFRKEDTDLLDAFNAELEDLPRHARAHRPGRALRLRRRLPAEQDHRRALRRRNSDRGAAARRPRPTRRCAMGLGTLTGMLLAALAVIGLLATSPTTRSSCRSCCRGRC